MSVRRLYGAAVAANTGAAQHALVDGV
jgi:hypothetical protein